MSIACQTTPSPTALIETHFGILQAPRALHSIEHKLIDIVIITICGTDNWEAIAEYGRTKEDWLKTFLALPNRIPSADTFIRVFARLKPEALQSCLLMDAGCPSISRGGITQH
jgi:hypothetical protein